MIGQTFEEVCCEFETGLSVFQCQLLTCPTFHSQHAFAQGTHHSSEPKSKLLLKTLSALPCSVRLEPCIFFLFTKFCYSSRFNLLKLFYRHYSIYLLFLYFHLFVSCTRLLLISPKKGGKMCIHYLEYDLR